MWTLLVEGFNNKTALCNHESSLKKLSRQQQNISLFMDFMRCNNVHVASFFLLLSRKLTVFFIRNFSYQRIGSFKHKIKYTN